MERGALALITVVFLVQLWSNDFFIFLKNEYYDNIKISPSKTCQN